MSFITNGSDFTEPYAIFLQNRHREAQAYVKEKVSILRAKGYFVNGLVVWGDSVAATMIDTR